MTRDHIVTDWKFPEQGLITQEDFGSGYPAGNQFAIGSQPLLYNILLSDPVTKKWLASNTDPVFGFPSVVRFSWSTAANILSSDALSVHWSVYCN